MLTKIFVDRSKSKAAIAIGTTWIAFVIALPIFEPGGTLIDIAIGALVAAGLIIFGFAAASRVRPMTKREGNEVLRFMGWLLALGVLMAIINLAVNLGMASLDPTIRELLVQRFGEIPPLVSVFAAPVIEEVIFRLFCMSVVAIIVSRFGKNKNTVFWIALVVSALVFGLMHVLRPQPDSLDLVWLYGVGVTLKSTFGGLLLGWIFWRWGLGYSIVCHGAINGVHHVLEPFVF